MSFGDYLSSVVMQWTKLETSIGAIGRLRTFSDTVAPEDKAEEQIAPGEEWPTHGRIEVQNISAAYESVLHILEQSYRSPVDLFLVPR